MTRVIAFALLVCAPWGLGASQHKECIPILYVKISELASAPGFYNNVVVRVRGAAVMRFEAEFICESADDIDSGSRRCVGLQQVAKNGLLGPLDPDLYHNKVVILTGVFDKDYGGSDALKGAIAPISIKIIGSHTKGDIPPPPPEPSANNSFNPMPLRGTG